MVKNRTKEKRVLFLKKKPNEDKQKEWHRKKFFWCEKQKDEQERGE